MLRYTRPLSELKTHAIAKKPTPTAENPHPATSAYLYTPSPINKRPISTIIKVAHPKMVFLFIPIIIVVILLEPQISGINSIIKTCNVIIVII